ncbi:unnamed protein product [Trichogramma brassicae]|uniref:Uncharacterized protein n=1 Tax=Trichogramma brassicae TaxID=86971 RepID=A0A6H5IBL3_9HYME|nr:unnamed protein product [Trichogramma brassicae]
MKLIIVKKEVLHFDEETADLLDDASAHREEDPPQEEVKVECKEENNEENLKQDEAEGGSEGEAGLKSSPPASPPQQEEWRVVRALPRRGRQANINIKKVKRKYKRVLTLACQGLLTGNHRLCRGMKHASTTFFYWDGAGARGSCCLRDVETGPTYSIETYHVVGTERAMERFVTRCEGCSDDLWTVTSAAGCRRCGPILVYHRKKIARGRVAPVKETRKNTPCVNEGLSIGYQETPKKFWSKSMTRSWGGLLIDSSGLGPQGLVRCSYYLLLQCRQTLIRRGKSSHDPPSSGTDQSHCPQNKIHRCETTYKDCVQAMLRRI